MTTRKDFTRSSFALGLLPLCAAAATTETIISVTSTGPFTLNYVNPANDPSRSSPYGP